MQIDWFTTSAQIINFLLLVALLKRFLYAPITRAMAQREAHIATRLQEAQDKATAADHQVERYNQQLKNLQESQESLLAEAREAAEQQRQKLLDQARQDVQQLQERWQQALRHEQNAFVQALRQQAGLQVCALTRRVLGDLAGVELEQRIIDLFLARLQQLDKPAIQALTAAASQAQFVVQSAFALPLEAQQQIMQSLHEHIVKHVEVQFETQPDLLCGIAVVVPGQQRIAWSIDDYLQHFEEHFAAMLAQEAVVH